MDYKLEEAPQEQNDMPDAPNNQEQGQSNDAHEYQNTIYQQNNDRATNNENLPGDIADFNENMKHEPMLDKPSNHGQEAEASQLESQQSTVIKVLKILFRDFSVDTITFNIFLINCVMWFTEVFLYYYILFKQEPDYKNKDERDYYRSHAWDCILIRFYGQYPPTTLYLIQIWRLVLSGFVFNGSLQFYFNNMAFNILGYSLEKESRSKLILCFLFAMLIGNLFSACFSSNNSISTGISCGIIGILPLQIIRYFRLRITNPLLASKSLRFIIIALIFNFTLNLLSLLGIGKVDWMAHIGSLFSGILTVILCGNLFEVFCPVILAHRRSLIRIIQGVTLFILTGIVVGLLLYGILVKGTQSDLQQQYLRTKVQCQQFV